MPKERIVAPSKDFAKLANVSLKEYKTKYKESIEKPEKFWAEQAKRLTWFKKWTKVLKHDFAKAKVEWFVGGKLNVSYNCLDRHLDSPHRNKAALIWEGDNPDESRVLTYHDLHREVNHFANVLKKFHVKKGDRVLIYLPMIPELAIATLACTRIGAVHSVVFGGFSPEALLGRIEDCKPTLVITADGGYRGGKPVELKKNVDVALEESKYKVKDVIVVKRTGDEGNLNWKESRDHWYHYLMKEPDIKKECPPVVMDSEDPLFILYTSGSTGKPKGVLHTTAGYLLGANLTFATIFDYKETDTYWCTADIGWITGHSYILYGPLSNGATSLMFEGVPSYPDAGRFWDVIDKYKVTVFYTAPTAIRALMREGIEPIKKRSLASLRLLGSVGEPINPEAWEWYHTNIGKSKCPIVDTWWQTETGSIMISGVPGAIPQKPGSASWPFYGILPVLVDNEGVEIKDKGEISGNLCISKPWPSMMRGVYGDPKRFFDTYFSQFKGYYFTGDGANKDKDGYFRITGRVDDVLNVSGHRIGSAEVESALVEHKSVAEAAVVGFPHDIKGQGIYAYVTVKHGVTTNDALKKELIAMVEKVIGKIARPEVIHWAPGLPKTRSGKIMRRILRKIANNEFDTLGDISTLADPSVVQSLIDDKKKFHS
ncbi:acetate--CoA ligase [Leptospira bandrabouensis]|uniref:acetate--CoA ligase n=1 Tax=Leptospira bandrabouensis TaxID=2484903 RepID=UPI00223D1572|nr:acetate--CoA ligase [Leptospira bandrabouensis]MCW7457505.1 acetate--CoA ligase [Leptospira bandrabouensis]MCW7476219.1 acetate--CoA ligase [Leptospira bandrabouensis]MCW7483902.1 acetate--CoA ligase [Leptospira bandrabouensis]